MMTNIEHVGPCRLIHHNIVADGMYGKGNNITECSQVSIQLGGKDAQYDRHIRISFVPVDRTRWRRFLPIYTITPTGLDAFELEIDGVAVWDSSDLFPVYCSLEAAREARQEQHELEMSRYDGMTEEEHWARFVALVEKTNAKYE